LLLLLLLISATRLGEILPFGRNCLALGEYFSEKYRPKIWANFPLKNRP
jgi:hypothetical protein